MLFLIRNYNNSFAFTYHIHNNWTINIKLNYNLAKNKNRRKRNKCFTWQKRIPFSKRTQWYIVTGLVFPILCSAEITVRDASQEVQIALVIATHAPPSGLYARPTGRVACRPWVPGCPLTQLIRLTCKYRTEPAT